MATPEKQIATLIKQRDQRVEAYQKALNESASIEGQYKQEKSGISASFFQSPERSPAIRLINSVVNALPKPEYSSTNEAKVRNAIDKTEERTNVLTGAYLLFMNDIKSGYDSSWFSKGKEHNSALYKILESQLNKISEKPGAGLSDKGQLRCLKALERWLSHKDAAELDYSSEAFKDKFKDMLAEQIQTLDEKLDKLSEAKACDTPMS